jgi:hypothetical protein
MSTWCAQRAALVAKRGRLQGRQTLARRLKVEWAAQRLMLAARAQLLRRVKAERVVWA